MSFIIAIICCACVLIIMGFDDWKDNMVSGVYCLIAWVTSMVAWFLCGRNLNICIVLLILFVAFYITPGESFINSADILPIAMYIATFVQLGSRSMEIFMFPFCTLLVMIPYGKFYAHANGFKWKFGDKVPMPMLPCFAAAWCLSVICVCIYRAIA